MYVPIELCKIKEINSKKHVIDTEVNLCNYFWTGKSKFVYPILKPGQDPFYSIGHQTECTYVKVGIALNIEDYNDIKQNLFATNVDVSDQASNQATKIVEYGRSSFRKPVEIRKLNHLSNYLLLSKLVKIFFEPSSKKFS